MHKFHHLTGAYIVVILYPSNKSSEKPQKRDMKNKTSIWTHLVYLFCTSLADITLYSFSTFFLIQFWEELLTMNEMKMKWRKNDILWMKNPEKRLHHLVHYFLFTFLQVLLNWSYIILSIFLANPFYKVIFNCYILNDIRSLFMIRYTFLNH